METLLTKKRSLMRPASICRFAPFRAISSASRQSSGTPRSRAKWLYVPAGITAQVASLFISGCTPLRAAPPGAVIPLVLQIREADLATTAVDALSPEQRAKLTLTVSYSVEGKEPMTEVETHTKNIVEWARLHGPFEAIGVAPQGVAPDVAGYAVKRLAVTAQGLNVAARIVLPPMSADDLTKLYE